MGYIRVYRGRIGEHIFVTENPQILDYQEEAEWKSVNLVEEWDIEFEENNCQKRFSRALKCNHHTNIHLEGLQHVDFIGMYI